MFELDPRLAQSCLVMGRFPLSLLLLNRDANYPWFLLVPRREAATEIYQLETADQRQLLAESAHLSQILMREFTGDKLNVAALGNQVPQLHVHHVVRYRDDVAWPDPVWGAAPFRPYGPGEAEGRSRQVVRHLKLDFAPD